MLHVEPPHTHHIITTTTIVLWGGMHGMAARTSTYFYEHELPLPYSIYSSSTCTYRTTLLHG